MTKVEELRDELLRVEEYEFDTDAGGLVTERMRHLITKEELDSLIAAAHAEGVVEGAEQALNMAQRWIDREWLASRHVVTLPHDILLEASVLAPTKESEK